MNERIRLLAEQAGYKPIGTFADELMEIYNKKFAKLIVQECIDYCGENLSKTVAGALKIHLGIER